MSFAYVPENIRVVTENAIIPRIERNGKRKQLYNMPEGKKHSKLKHLFK